MVPFVFINNLFCFWKSINQLHNMPLCFYCYIYIFNHNFYPFEKKTFLKWFFVTFPLLIKTFKRIFCTTERYITWKVNAIKSNWRYMLQQIRFSNVQYMRFFKQKYAPVLLFHRHWIIIKRFFSIQKHFMPLYVW